MKNFIQKTKCGVFILRFMNGCILLSFVSSVVLPPPYSHAQESLFLPAPGTMVVASPNFIPAVMKGIKIFPDNPLRFDFIIDTGHSNLAGDALKTESTKLIKYFLATLTIPEDDLWVNLSPYEKDRIIPDKFGVTEMGRDLLAQDYVLKQLTASLIYPEEELGKKFWDKVYAKVSQLYGTTELPINTFNKVWIVPDKAVVYESGDTAFIMESHLKVMLEGDYLALDENMDNEEMGADRLDKGDVEQLNDVSSAIIKEVILPEIEKEVNTGENFTSLRQVYNSMILATWFKRNLKESFLSKVYVGENKIAGVDIQDKKAKEKIYQQYLEAFKKGVYNYIKEDYDSAAQEVIPRKYFSGGMEFRGDTLPYLLGDGDDRQNVPSQEMIKAAEASTTGKDITASVILDPVKNLDRLRRILNVLAQSDNIPQVPQGASEDVILEFVLSHLEAGGLIKETRNEADDVKVFVIKDEVKESELGRAVQRWVIEPRGGVKAINFKGIDGIWKIVGFTSEMTPEQIEIEKAEVGYRKEGKHWIEAFNLANQATISQKEAKARYKVAQRDILSASSHPSLKRGQKIYHQKFGIGHVVKVEPENIQLRFREDDPLLLTITPGRLKILIENGTLIIPGADGLSEDDYLAAFEKEVGKTTMERIKAVLGRKGLSRLIAEHPLAIRRLFQSSSHVGEEDRRPDEALALDEDVIAGHLQELGITRLYHGTSNDAMRNIIASGGFIRGELASNSEPDRDFQDAVYFSLLRDVSKDFAHERTSSQGGFLLEFDIAALLNYGVKLRLGTSVYEEELFTRNPVPLSALTTKSKRELARRFKSDRRVSQDHLAKVLGFRSYKKLLEAVTVPAESHAKKGEASPTDEAPRDSGPIGGTAEDSAILAEQLDTAINRAQDVQTETARPTQNPGGIDLNPKMLNIQKTGTGMKFDIQINPQAIQNISIDGFSPIIFQIIPTNLPLLLGTNTSQPEQQLSSIQ